MKDRLDKIEAQLQRLIEGSTDYLFGSESINQQIVHRLVSALEGNLHINEAGATIAPSNFALLIHNKFTSNEKSGEAVIKFITDKLVEVATQNDISFSDKPTITIYSDGAIPVGEFEIHVLQPIDSDESMGSTEGILIGEKESKTILTSKPFLIPDNNKIIDLDRSIINIGRELDNQLVLDDMRVSRKHAQLRATENHFLLFDLQSSGGTFVNGEQISQVALEAGDVISFAGLTMVYGEDAIPHQSETEEYKVGSNSHSDSSSTSSNSVQ